MSCYLRHLKPIFEEAGIEVTRDNRKDIDRLVHELMGVDYKNCPATWARLKEVLVSPRERREFVTRLKSSS